MDETPQDNPLQRLTRAMERIIQAQVSPKRIEEIGQEEAQAQRDADEELAKVEELIEKFDPAMAPVSETPLEAFDATKQEETAKEKEEVEEERNSDAAFKEADKMRSYMDRSNAGHTDGITKNIPFTTAFLMFFACALLLFYREVVQIQAAGGIEKVTYPLTEGMFNTVSIFVWMLIFACIAGLVYGIYKITVKGVLSPGAPLD